jgi:hypothetical protein
MANFMFGGGFPELAPGDAASAKCDGLSYGVNSNLQISLAR